MPVVGVWIEKIGPGLDWAGVNGVINAVIATNNVTLRSHPPLAIMRI
jgi:hypothetical protein